MDRLITAIDIAKRDRMVSVQAWFRAVSARFQQVGRIPTMWDGRTVSGLPVDAIVREGRVLAQCDICGSHEYVDEKSRMFYCMSCGNGGSTAARPVRFPEDWERVEAALAARPVVEGWGKDYIEKIMRSRPFYTGLSRRWDPGTSAEELEDGNRRMEASND